MPPGAPRSHPETLDHDRGRRCPGYEAYTFSLISVPPACRQEVIDTLDRRAAQAMARPPRHTTFLEGKRRIPRRTPRLNERHSHQGRACEVGADHPRRQRRPRLTGPDAWRATAAVTVSGELVSRSGQNADTSDAAESVPYKCQPKSLYRLEPPPIPSARCPEIWIERLPLSKRWLLFLRTARRPRGSRNYERAGRARSGKSGHFRRVVFRTLLSVVAVAGAKSKHWWVTTLPPPPVLSYSPTALCGSTTKPPSAARQEESATFSMARALVRRRFPGQAICPPEDPVAAWFDSRSLRVRNSPLSIRLSRRDRSQNRRHGRDPGGPTSCALLTRCCFRPESARINRMSSDADADESGRVDTCT